MQNTTKENIGSPSHNDDNGRKMTNSERKFLDAHGFRSKVGAFTHYHFIGKMTGYLASKAKHARTEVKSVWKKCGKKEKKAKITPTDSGWDELEPTIHITYDDIKEMTSKADAMTRSIYHSKCFWCGSHRWGQWGLTLDTHWLNLHCRSCDQTYYYHPDFGFNSLNGMMAQHEQIAREDPYLKWLLQMEGIEMNPGPGENTKRDSKRRPPKGDTRMEKLANRNPDIHKRIQIMAQKVKIGKAQQKQFDQMMKSLAPRLQGGFGIPVTLKMETFQDIFEAFVSTLPPEISQFLEWAEVGASIYCLIFDTTATAKFLACRNLYRTLGIQAMAVASFSALMLHVMRLLGFITPFKNFPRLEMEPTSTLATIMTLILTILFRKQPSKSRVEAALSTLKDLSPLTRGMELLLGVFQAGINYVKGLFVGPDEVTQAINDITKRVKYYLSVEGQKAISLNLGSFVELAELQQKAMEVEAQLSGSRRLAFRTVQQHLNSLYRKASLTPISGHTHRKRPVVVHLWGEAGIGKTRIINLISADTMSTILSLDGFTGKDLEERVVDWAKYVYFSPAGLKHEQNFNSHYSRIYVCDDANQVQPTNKSDGIDWPIKLISLNNSHDHMLPVAELEQKKDARFNSALIIATDNAGNPDLSKSVTNEEAYYRRLDFSYNMRLKREFSKEQIISGKTIRVVDMNKIDRKTVNTEIYEFEDPNTKRIYTYEQFIQQIISLLEHVHMSHKDDVTLFSNYALERLEKIREEESVEDDEITVYDITQISEKDRREAGPSGITKTETTPSTQDSTRVEDLVAKQQTNHELMQELGKIYDDLVADEALKELHEKINYKRHSYASNSTRGRGRGKPKTQGRVGFFAEEEKVTVEELESVQRQQESRMPFWLAFLVLKIQSFYWFSKMKERIFPTKESAFKKYTRMLIMAGGLAIAAYGIYKYSTRKKGKKRNVRAFANDLLGYGAGDAKGKKPPPKKPPTAPFKPSKVFRGEATEVTTINDLKQYANNAELQLANTPSYVVQKLLCSNAYLIQIIWTGEADGRRKGGLLRGFFLKGSLFLVNRHLVAVTKKEWESAVFNLYGVFGDTINVKCTDTSVVELQQDGACHHDVVAIDFGKKVRTHLDITKLFGGEIFVKHDRMQELQGKKCSLFTVMLNSQYETTTTAIISPTDETAWYAEIQHTYIKYVNGEYMTALDSEGNELYTYDTLEYEVQGVPGYCGSVVVMNDPELGGRIVGIHMAGYDNADTSYAQILSLEMIQAFEARLQCSVVKFIDEEPKTVLNLSKFQVLGTIKQPIRSVAKSKISKTPIHGELMETTKKPAKLGFHDGKHVVNTAMLKYLGPIQALTPTESSLFKSLLLSQFGPTRKLREFDLATAIRGEQGSAYIFPINRSSSPGYPLCQETKRKGKTEYLGSDENYIVDHPRVLELVEEYVKDAESLNNTRAYFVVTAKDELRLIEKVDQGKTRCFAAAPLAFTIVMRMKYLDMAANIMENRIANSSMVGINCYSQEWDCAARKLLGVSPPNAHQFVAGDFTNFDGSLNRDLLWAIYSFMEACYSRVDDPVALSVWRDLLESKQIFGNAVIQIIRGHPSGHPLTAILNTLYNAGLMYLVIYQILEEIGTVESFSIQENLINEYSALFYGDDNVIAFSKRLAQIIEPEMLPQMMTRYGHIYTTDAKDGRKFEYKTMNDISILKRKFFRDDGMWYAPLEMPSIFEPLNWDKVKPFQFEEKRKQAAVNMRIAIRELSLHSRESFDEWVTKIKELALQNRIQLTPDCFYDQTLLRSILKRGIETPFFFCDDGYSQASLNAENSLTIGDEFLIYERNTTVAVVECSKETQGMHVHAGSRLDGSPIEELHPKAHKEFCPTPVFN